VSSHIAFSRIFLDNAGDDINRAYRRHQHASTTPGARKIDSAAKKRKRKQRKHQYEAASAPYRAKRHGVAATATAHRHHKRRQSIGGSIMKNIKINGNDIIKQMTNSVASYGINSSGGGAGVWRQADKHTRYPQRHCLTAHSTHARWRIALSTHQHRNHHGRRLISAS